MRVIGFDNFDEEIRKCFESERKMEKIVQYDAENEIFVIKMIDLKRRNLENLSFEDIDNARNSYHIPLGRCDNPGKFIDWLKHLCEKSWISIKIIEHFIRRMRTVSREKNLEGFIEDA